MRRTLVAIIAAGALITGLIPAAAGIMGSPQERGDAETYTDTTQARAGAQKERPEPEDAAPAAVRPSGPSSSDPHPPDRLVLACRGLRTEDGSGIGCRWSPAQHPDFAEYLLWRGDRENGEPEVVFRTDERSETRHLDRDVEPGAVYVYLVQVIDADGRTIGVGGPVRTQAPPERPKRPEELRLACRGVHGDPSSGIACRWSPAQHPDFAEYLLWRGDRQSAERQVVHRTDDRDATRFFDADVRPGGVYVYWVQVVDTEGNVIGSGGPVRAQAPSEPSITPEVLRR